jgi:hypothetical protein
MAFGVLAPNAPWRQAVVARDVVPAPMAEAVTPVSAERPAAGEERRPRVRPR